MGRGKGRWGLGLEGQAAGGVGEVLLQQQVQGRGWACIIIRIMISII